MKKSRETPHVGRHTNTHTNTYEAQAGTEVKKEGKGENVNC